MGRAWWFAVVFLGASGAQAHDYLAASKGYDERLVARILRTEGARDVALVPASQLEESISQAERPILASFKVDAGSSLPDINGIPNVVCQPKYKTKRIAQMTGRPLLDGKPKISGVCYHRF